MICPGLDSTRVTMVCAMKLIAQIKLQPTAEQAGALRQTMEAANRAANFVSGIAWDTQQFNKYALRHACYYAIRSQYGLSAEITALVVFKVAYAYKLNGKVRHTFKPLGGIAYNDRILRIVPDKRTVSIWTLSGRQQVTFVCGERQMVMLQGRRGESDLVLRHGEFYLLVTCDVEDPEPAPVDDFLGVDMGIVNIAVDSDGTTHQGKTVNNVRHRHRKLRAKLQRKGTKSCRRRLKKLAGKERRFATWVNHNVSKSIVAKAKDTGRGIAIEELGGILDRVTARRSQRATLHSWSFFQLRTFLTYKGRLSGVSVVAVERHNTSLLCPACGCTEKANRKSQTKFLCVSCGFSGLADHIAAMNISRRAVVNRPYVSDAQTIVQRQGQNPKVEP